MPIPSKITKMPARLSLLLLQAGKMAGRMYPPAEALSPVEEHMTLPEINSATAFLEWLHKHSLTVGHGTIDLRWTEFKRKLAPATKDEAYQYAMQKAGL
jgi:hypothetical protein